MQKKSIIPRIEIDLQFDPEIGCVKELSGIEFTFQIEHIQGIIAFPKISPEITRENYENGVLPPDNADLQITRHKEINWGHVYGFPVDGLYVGNLRAWVEVSDMDNFEIEGNFLYEKLPKWRDLLQEYIEIMTKKSLRYSPPMRHPLDNDLDMVIWKRDGDGFRAGYPFNKTGSIIINHGTQIALDELDFLFILEKIKSLTSPPLEYQLLNEARVDYKNENLEKAVVQASTAVEIVLGRLIEKVIEERVGRGFLKILGNLTLGKKFDTAVALEFDLPSFGYTKSMVALRNDVTHSWKKPTKREVGDLIRAVEGIIDNFFPLRN